MRSLVAAIASVRCVRLHANVVNFRQTRRVFVASVVVVSLVVVASVVVVVSVAVVVVCSLSQSTSTRASGAQFGFDQRV